LRPALRQGRIGGLVVDGIVAGVVGATVGATVFNTAGRVVVGTV
jgi:hypothetical protein